MKLKTKKLIIEAIFIIGITVVIGLIILGFSGYFDAEFKIYKEESLMKINQTVYDNCVAKYDNNWDIEGTSYTTKVTPKLEDGVVLFEFTENTTMTSLNIGGKIIRVENCIDINLFYEVYEQVEVEKMWFGETEIGKCSVAVILGDERCIKIGIKDLTIDWLDSECECRDYDNDFYKNLICNKYKCGEYFVEVIK